MKILVVIYSLILIYGCERNQVIEIDASINITKTEEGYNIYSNTGELILEYTKQNCDSSSLVTLEEIYLTAKQFYNKDIPNEEKKVKTIAYEK